MQKGFEPTLVANYDLLQHFFQEGPLSLNKQYGMCAINMGPYRTNHVSLVALDIGPFLKKDH
jgi:hypothetical protein